MWDLLLGIECLRGRRRKLVIDESWERTAIDGYQRGEEKSEDWGAGKLHFRVYWEVDGRIWLYGCQNGMSD